MSRQLPRKVLHRKKKAFAAPFGTPCIGADATEQIRDLLSPAKLLEFGYFDPCKVRAIVEELASVKEAIAQDPGDTMRPDQTSIHRTVLGMALTFVVSTQILEDYVRRGIFAGK